MSDIARFRGEIQFQHTAARRRLSLTMRDTEVLDQVSTHSRPKAAVDCGQSASAVGRSFNTQPPEGGCEATGTYYEALAVSTHSRPKAAVQQRATEKAKQHVSTHSRPKAAVLITNADYFYDFVSTHSRPKAAVNRLLSHFRRPKPCFNTQPPEGGCLSNNTFSVYDDMFQHTAARRRL
ncbi:Uncharacterised protein [Neisseria weaveri]|uniref:Uncharacterized protein n=1 Tax=Neisseria weaveri TaxID=28091 RepID=A0A448VHV2_9NEIS|nr:Uncharacterised protein [Neisseria weaveri]